MERRLAAIVIADVVGYSKLIRANEEGTRARFQALQDDLFGPLVASHGGRVIKTMGDAFLLEFPSAVEAVACAVDVQRDLHELEADKQAEWRIQFRIGINVGDIIVEGNDIHGDGVNVAARLEAICEPGGLCISDMVRQAIVGKIELAFDDLGARELKNIDTPVRVWQWRQDPVDGEIDPAADSKAPPEQQIKFCTAADGTTIAYAVIGKGAPLVKAPNWMNHLEYDWQSPVWRHVLRELSRDNTLIRFDQRGNGLSDRHVADLSFDSMVGDLARVVDATGLDRFALFGISQGCLYSIAYAAQFPERISRLVLYGGFAMGGIKSGNDYYIEQAELYRQMILQGWGKDNPAFRQFFTSLFMPDASTEQMDWFNELQRMTTSAKTAARLVDLVANADVTGLLAEIKAPTLVLHCRDDGIAPFEAGRRMAARIPNARFVALEGRNHLILEDEPAWPRFLAEVRRFLAEEE